MEVVCISLGVVLTMLAANLALSFKEKSANDMYAGYESLIEFSAGDFDKSINYFYVPCYNDKNIQMVSKNKNIKLLTGYKNLRLNDQIIFISDTGISYIGNDVVGASPEVISILNASLHAGKNSLKKNQAVIGFDVSQKWGINIGDIIQIPFNGHYINYQITGILEHKREALFDTKAEVLNNIILINHLDQIFDNVKYSAILASVYDINKINETGNDLIAMLSEDQSLVKTLKNLGYKPVAATRKNVALMITRYVEYASLFIYLFTVVAYGITIAFLTSSAAMQVIERSKEIGILSAIGLTRTQIIFISVFASLFVGMVSLLVGLSFSWFIQIFLCNILSWNMCFDLVSLLMAIIMCLIILPLMGFCYGIRQFRYSTLALLRSKK